MEFFCVIPPIWHQELTEYSPGYFALAQFVLKYPHYADFYKQKSREGSFVVLDNGAAEGSLVSDNELLEAIHMINPSEVIAPDVFYQAQPTLQRLETFLQLLRDNKIDVPVQAVPQGSCMKEWLDSYEEMTNNKLVATIGLSKFGMVKCFKEQTHSDLVSVNRQYCIEYLTQHDMLKKPMHLLGMQTPFEYVKYRGNNFVRSTDSCLPVLTAVKGIVFTDKFEEETKGKDNNDYFNLKFEKDWKDQIHAKTLFNICFLNNIIKATRQ